MKLKVSGQDCPHCYYDNPLVLSHNFFSTASNPYPVNDVYIVP